MYIYCIYMGDLPLQCFITEGYIALRLHFLVVEIMLNTYKPL